jgi:hypothetical protein
MTSSGTIAAGWGVIGCAGGVESSQHTSAGRISVATPPGARMASATARAPSVGTASGVIERWTQEETVPATASISLSSGAS